MTSALWAQTNVAQNENMHFKYVRCLASIPVIM